MLQVFTLSYPDSNQQGPKFMILFTNFSKYETTIDTGNLSYDDEDSDDSATAVKNGPCTDSGISFDQYITRFKSDVVEQLMQDQSMHDDRYTLQKIVDRVLPKENFFAFKMEKKFTTEQNNQEKCEISQIIDKTIQNGNYKMGNTSESYL